MFGAGFKNYMEYNIPILTEFYDEKIDPKIYSTFGITTKKFFVSNQIDTAIVIMSLSILK